MSGSVHRCFPVNFAKFLRTSFLIEHLYRLCLIFANVPLHSNAFRYLARGGSRAAATSKMECFVIIVKRLPAVNYYYRVLHLGCLAALGPPLLAVRTPESIGINVSIGWYWVN